MNDECCRDCLKRLSSKLLLVFSLLLLLLSCEEAKSVKKVFIVTGSTGALGSALLHTLLEEAATTTTATAATIGGGGGGGETIVYGTYRQLHKVDSFHRDLKRKKISSNTLLPQWIHLDFQRHHRLDSRLGEGGDCYGSRMNPNPVLLNLSPVREAERVVLINNAGLCLPHSSKHTLQQSLAVNTLGPWQLISELLELAREDDQKVIDVINVSSGEGELCFLHSSLAQAIGNINNLTDFNSFIKSLLTSFDDEIEYAMGNTPMYSLSKALLNHLTRLLHEQAPGNCRIIACCPGNFESVMTTEEERLTAQPVEEAAANLLRLMRDRHRYPGGLWYRYGEKIDW